MRSRAAALGVGVPLAAAAVLMLAACGGSDGGKRHYNATATLKPVAGVPAGPTGSFGAYWDKDGRRLTYSLAFSHMSGRPTSAGVYARRPGEQPLLIIRICGPCKRPKSVILGATKPFANVFDSYLNSGSLYVLVDTKKRPKGEIRGPLRRQKGGVCEACS